MIFDVIIIGGGSAGCAAAAGLSADPSLSVCLIEAGGDNDDIRVKTPGLMPFLPEKTNWQYETVPQSGLNGRVGYQPRGKGLGGSSAINAMVYIRGNAYDYDHWAKIGCTGWHYDAVLPWFKAMENNARYGDGGEFDAFHGGEGPLHVTDQNSPNPLSEKFVKAAEELQLPRNDDFNGRVQSGFGLYQTTQYKGERWSASRAFIEPNKHRPKLTILTGRLVEKILFENGRATGVQLRGRLAAHDVVKARAAVILSAGAFGSPQILQMSGFGDAEDIARHGIKMQVESPDVGKNLQDHVDYVSSFETPENQDSFGQSAKGTLRMARAMVQHRLLRSGVMTTCWAEGGGFWTVGDDAPAPDVQYHFVPAMLEDHGRTKIKGHGFSLHVCPVRPYSRGTVRIADSAATSAPLIDPQFLADDRDMETLKHGVRLSYRLTSAPALAAYGPVDRHPIDLDDDDALEHMIRERADTIYHPVGTCRMGADAAAVVSPRLKANGVDGLYIADASIMPTLVSGNTNAPSIMIGMRCAEFVAEDLKS